jgi:hypothetical protein
MKAIVLDHTRLPNVRQVRYQFLIKTFLWFWACTAALSLVPSKSHATRQKGSKTATVKGERISSPIGKLPNPPVKQLLNREKASADAAPLEIREHVVHRAEDGETLSSIVNRFRLPSSEKRRWSRALAAFGDRPLPQGKEVHFYFSKPTASSAFQSARLTAVELHQSDIMSLVWEQSNEAIVFQRVEQPYDIDLQIASAVVESSLLEDAAKAGMEPALLAQLSEIFSWDVQLDRDVVQGDTVKILYEKRTRKISNAKTSVRVLAAELLTGGRKHTAIYFEKQAGVGGYWLL